jgi:hypothetical protein
MRTVVIGLRTVDLATEMAAMRAWLDEYRYEPSKFTLDKFGDSVAVCIEFSKDEQAEAFKKRFDDQITESQSAPLLSA